MVNTLYVLKIFLTCLYGQCAANHVLCFTLYQTAQEMRSNRTNISPFDGDHLRATKSSFDVDHLRATKSGFTASRDLIIPRLV